MLDGKAPLGRIQVRKPACRQFNTMRVLASGAQVLPVWLGEYDKLAGCAVKDYRVMKDRRSTCGNGGFFIVVALA